MAEAALFSIATAILKSIASEIAKPGGSFASQEIQLLCCAKDELKSLQDTVQTIQAVLLDAEKKQWHDNQVKLWLGRLKDMLYDVQDLFDDVATENLRRKIMFDDVATENLRPKVTSGNKMSKAVRIFFSKSNQLAHRLRVANKIRELRKELDRIKSDKELSNLEQHLSDETIGRGKKPEVPSPDEKIIGREEDKKKIKQLLFDSSSSQSVSFVAIVGKGGLGKTALARLVYNDGEVKEHFGLKMWVCVSDVFNVNVIIKEILKSAKDNCQEHDDEMKRLLQDLENKPIHELPSLLPEILGRLKYLLVLDDLWNEDRNNWLKLGDWLEGGLRGSKILVTTRSHKVAKVTDAKSVIHVLNGLSEDKSWNLFRKMAFGDGVESSDPELEETGRDIVKKCAGVPLAIRTIGGLLYGKNKDEWRRYKVRQLPEIPEIDEVDDGIMQVLKFSYDRLPSCLKHCFAYCSLFPKDYVYNKEMMIHLWMAQGFIESLNGEDNLEDIADNYLSELLCRSFLDAARKEDDGEVLTFKMHDLMHDLAQKVAGGECKIVNFKGGDNDRGIRHALIISESFSEEKMVSLLKTSKLRTFLCLEGESSIVNSPKVFSGCKHCRALGLGNTDIPLPPSSFGKLKHLRFLNISANKSIQSLPDSITDLVSLQILELIKCDNLKTFPKNLRKLVNLRYLKISGCDSLSHLPPLSEVPSLRTLILWSLDALEFLQQTSDPEQSDTTRPFFPSLEKLSLCFCSNLKGWWGRKLVMGAYQKHRSDNSLSSFPKLWSVNIRGCPHLNFMPPFPQVEYLFTNSTKTLEQQLMVNPNCPSEAAVGSTFIPFSKLKSLVLNDSDVEPSMLETLLRLPSNLESMGLYFCYRWCLSRSMQNLSSLQKLDIIYCEGLDILCQEDKHGNQWRFLTKLRVLKITGSMNSVALPEGIQHVTTLQSLEISDCWKLQSLPEWIGNLSLLEKLVLSDCTKLKRLPFGMRNLTRLKELRILHCPTLKESYLTDGREDRPKIPHIPVIVWED
ncbi:putative disease resistance protein RGA1 [Syzygium oleosum]|uniref:putative disease resistance protein RGA1 n=1 Tax=Syzygium oleosum TaxID=219896 RepID=UPI0024BA0035|nr:putative disease resistance protein RGA1 [Syzygium oleosum]